MVIVWACPISIRVQPGGSRVFAASRGERSGKAEMRLTIREPTRGLRGLWGLRLRGEAGIGVDTAEGCVVGGTIGDTVDVNARGVNARSDGADSAAVR
mmetsp:Transcript_10027/g.25975  ORF Transcript_10027/g.25975 Transcript_10027/m.25975 type:complete len:98 (+) Transcript_10027:521-814(+)